MRRVMVPVLFLFCVGARLPVVTVRRRRRRRIHQSSWDHHPIPVTFSSSLACHGLGGHT